MTRYSLWLVAGLVVWGMGGQGDPVHAGVVVQMGDSGEYLELRHSVEQTMIERLPLYRSGGLRYFSAGVGVEERMAEYPPFSLKLVFTAGGKPYLAGVSVTIQPASGGTALTIPPEQVEGPWLFVDLPSGIYDVTATHGDRRQSLTRIQVDAGQQRTIHLRWAEDRGLPVKLAE
jgi:hypothetical protein